MTCSHPSFVAETRVGRVSDDGAKVVGIALDVRVRCAVCGVPFRFVGLPTGSVDSTVMRAPIEAVPGLTPISAVAGEA